MSERLCRCAHLTSDHEFVGTWTEGMYLLHGSPCNKCKADPSRQPGHLTADLMCHQFDEWPIADIPWPGTDWARELGCICPVRVNVRRAAEKLLPVYTPGCGVHDWVCQRKTACNVLTDEHPEMVDHLRPHESCEHCTIPRIACTSCAAMWTDWRVRPEQVGWTLNYDKEWRCSTCRQ